MRALRGVARELRRIEAFAAGLSEGTTRGQKETLAAVVLLAVAVTLWADPHRATVPGGEGTTTRPPGLSRVLEPVLSAPGGLLAAAVGAAPAATSTAPSAEGTEPTDRSDPLAGLPAGVPDLARRAEEPLPKPAAWPFADAFPRTSGTGRLAPGAFEWTDFIYDDRGARGTSTGGFTVPTSGSPATGTYAYPPGPAMNNGADIFRVGIGLDDAAAYWRVDWTTLNDPAVPIAVFTVDVDNKAGTGAIDWPAGAGLRSAGIEWAIVMSSRGTWLHDLGRPSSEPRALAPPSVDLAARSFVARIPRSVLEPRGPSVVRVAAGLANQSGAGFAPVPGGSLPGQPPIYNVAFRAIADEPAAGNYWMEDAQAAAIGAGDVSAFGELVDWARLAAGDSTPEPAPAGFSMRWYRSMIEVDQGGIVTNAGGAVQDERPNYNGRLQPYGVVVPRSYDGSQPARLTWLLHSLSSAHTQYSAGPATFLEQACETRRSICVMPLGRGPDHYWYDEGELDLWEVWNRVATVYHLDPVRTVVTGFSMGGCGSYSWPLAWPDVFATAAPMAGLTANKTFRFLLPDALFPGSPEVTTLGFSPRYEAIGDQDRLLENARWLRLFITHGLRDELVPVSQAYWMAERLRGLGFRYRLQVHPAEGHSDWVAKGNFGAVAENLGNDRIATNPGRVTYVWFPARFHPEWGMAPTGAYWVKDVRASSSMLGVLARIDAVSKANPDPGVTRAEATSPLASTDPSPAVVRTLDWATGARPAREPRLDLLLRAVSALRIDMPAAGFRKEDVATVEVDSDSTVALTLSGLRPGAKVLLDGRRIAAADRGTATVDVAVGRHTIVIG